jgi:uncharacterized membrane protein YfcA
MSDALLIAIAALLSGVLDTVVGFGGGLLLLPVLVTILNPQNAIVFTALIPLGWTLTRIPLLRSFLDRQTILLFTAGIVPGAVLGSLLVSRIDPDMLRSGIGGLLIIMGLVQLVRLYVEIPGPRVRPRFLFPTTGFVAGGVSALLGAGNGPFQSWSMNAAGIRPRAIVAINGVIGAVLSLTRLVSYGAEGMMDEVPFVAGLAGVGGAIVGSLIGVRLGKRGSDSTLRVLIALVVVAAGIRLLLR